MRQLFFWRDDPRRTRRFTKLLWGGGGVLCLAVVGLALLLTGGRHLPLAAKAVVNRDPVVQTVKPCVRSIECAVDQPGFVEAYEQTSIFSKVSGFIKHLDVDIGQEIKCGDGLAEIFVPELEEEHQQKAAQVELDQRLVEQAQELVNVAQSSVQTALAQVAEARANVEKSQAEVTRWESELERLTQLVQEKVMDQQTLTETQKQLDSARAARSAAQAAVAAREAGRVTSQANLAKSRIDVETAKAKVKVSQADERKAAAMLSYTQVTAPYDGVVTARNGNTGDYVQAVTGDKSVPNPSAIFVVARNEMIRVFVDVPEEYARYVQAGTKAVVRAQALCDLHLPAAVTRTSWAIREKTRTMRAEIDLSADQYDGLRPGMYVYAKLLVERPDVHALPQRALAVTGNQSYCFLLDGNRAVRTAVLPGVSDGNYVEVVQMKIDEAWGKVTGNESVIVGDLTELTDGQAVRVQAEAAP